MSAKQLEALKMRSRQSPAWKSSAETCPSAQNESNILPQPAVPALAPGGYPLPVFCICNRDLQDILCRSCGYCFIGRVRKKCPVHPNAILLMDSPCCPKCQTVHLMEIRKSHTPVKSNTADAEEVEQDLKVWRRRRHSSSSSVGKPIAEIPESWETTLPSSDTKIQIQPPPKETTAKPEPAGFRRNLYPIQDSGVQRDYEKQIQDSQQVGDLSHSVHSAGNLGKRFADVSVQSASDTVERIVKFEVRRKQVLQNWEHDKEKMSEMWYGATSERR